jgi:hypothetical protein
MSITDLILNFRMALLALLPSLDHIGIEWRREGAYDEWDAIATVLFKNMVESQMKWALPEQEQDRFHLPPYDLLLSRYDAPGMIEVVLSSSTHARIFHAFGTSSEPLDSCECRVIHADGTPAAGEIESYLLSEVAFRMRYRMADSRVLILDTI